MDSNIYVEYMDLGGNVTVKKRYQWDHGIRMVITGAKDFQSVIMEFSNEHMTEAIRPNSEIIDNTVSCEIPDSLLKMPYQIFCYVTLYDSQAMMTVMHICIPLIPRPRPADYVCTPDEIIRFNDLVNKLNISIEEVEKLKESIGGGGTISKEDIAEAVADYLDQNGVTVEETDPTVSDWAKQPNKPTYMASEVGADASGTAASQVSTHNVSGSAHEDIRTLITDLTSRLNALADSDDTTLDQLSEIVSYIKNNKSLIDGITTGKVSVSDIVDNLTTTASGKPLSAAQGVKLKELIDAIIIPSSLPNPHALTINGTSYDGSAPVNVTVTSEETVESVEIDTTFTKSGAAADSAAVGQALNKKVESSDLPNLLGVKITLDENGAGTLSIEGK